MHEVRHVVGAMTGTSIDGIDVALVRIEGRGLAMKAALERHLWRPLGATGEQLGQAAARTALDAGTFAELGVALAHIHRDAIFDLLDTSQVRLDLVAVHGQTVFHAPPCSWQLLNPAPLAAALQCQVVCDLRQADLAAGGQGAPITPLADWILFRPDAGRRAVVNLGGFCNITILDSNTVIDGYDLCACNHVLNAVARCALGQPFDDEGQAAAAGRPAPDVVGALSDALRAQRQAARSLGTGDEVDARLLQDLSPNDAAATAVEAVASCIAEALAASAVDDVIVAGGGVHNKALIAAIMRHTGTGVRPSDELGIVAAAREATAIAVLGALSADGVAITLPHVTGCANPAPVAGAWTTAPGGSPA
jgi:1,6-anhydro-N-acetylmuramate kinase